MTVRILRSALDDLIEARRFYDLQQEGVGEYFFQCVFDDVDALARYAGVHAIHFGFHRFLLNRFPHAVYYRLRDDEVVIYRILDCRRARESHRNALTGL